MSSVCYGEFHEPTSADGRNGSIYEDYLADFLRELRKPVVTTMHTVLPNPSASMRKTVRAISELSDEIVVMAETAVTSCSALRH